MATKTEKEKKIDSLVDKGYSLEEATDIVHWDEVIDKGGETPFDLPKDKEKEAKKFANSNTKKKPTVYKFQTRERKSNPTKAAIIAELAEFLAKTSENACEMVEITNKERQIAFKIGENAYELTLVQKRKPKNG
jgi:hypothetical protein